jgi:hypothetical protein
MIFCAAVFTFSGGAQSAEWAWTHPNSLSDHISPDGRHVYSYNVAMDDNGNAIVEWSQYDRSYHSDSSYRQIFISEYRNGTWIHPSSVSDNISPDGQNAFGSHVAMDDNGNAIVVWRQPASYYYKLFMSKYRQSVDTDTDGDGM